ncbi:hypothetical protein K469DRAFT_329739 [Zopfia rhizophila CBS 207.26]|uniref:Uncharacterized protein n=1 Tax=Zopfia rhizophila CBS 207.26 TaxID=1314779 RepID=A0A6A6DGC6_9PEZI|nr:hypothetical protein K469DRAFT_329739 [Zopfia rhizophila CBS 207.26]
MMVEEECKAGRQVLVGVGVGGVVFISCRAVSGDAVVCWWWSPYGPLVEDARLLFLPGRVQTATVGERGAAGGPPLIRRFAAWASAAVMQNSRRTSVKSGLGANQRAPLEAPGLGLLACQPSSSAFNTTNRAAGLAAAAAFERQIETTCVICLRPLQESLPRPRS